MEKDCIHSACYEQSTSSSFVRNRSLSPFSSTHTSSYNSVISPVNPAYAYNVYQVTQDWVDNGFQTPTSSLFEASSEEPPYNYSSFTRLPGCDTQPRWGAGHSWTALDTDPFFVKFATDAKSGTLESLTPVDCIKAYNTVLQTQYSNLFLVFNESSSFYGSISGTTQWPTVSSIDSGESFGSILKTEVIQTSFLKSIGNSWLCELPGNCNIAALISNPADWMFEYCSTNPMLPSGQIACENASPGCWPRQAVEYCLAQPASATCSMQMSVELMTVVIVFNSVKIMCFVFTLWKGGFTPLVTLGDGMSSFLMKPDDTTKALAPVSAAQLRTCKNKIRQLYSCPRCGMLQKPKPAIESEPHTSSVQCDELFGLHCTAGLLASSASVKSTDTYCPITSKFFSTLETQSFSISSRKRKWFRGAGLLRWLLTYIV